MGSCQEWSAGPIIVGAGPSGLAVAALLAEKGVPSLLLERSQCIASLWQLKTYHRLKLHLPKQFCELPLMPFPSHFPKYPSKQQFVDYLESYAEKFSLRPRFGRLVVSGEFEGGLWRVRTADGAEYVSRWIVAATGENAEAVVPEIDGLDRFRGRIMHSSVYKGGADFEGKKVLVVGCGNSGMEVSLDLSMHHATPSMAVRDTVHVLPRDMLGFSTFGVAMALLKWLPLKVVDRILLLAANSTMGSTDQLGLRRPATGPLELKNSTGKTPVLDVGTLSAIKAGKIKVMKGVKEITGRGAKFVDGVEEEFDSIVLATGYKSNVPSWLKGTDFFTAKGMPIVPFPNGWKGGNGLYTVGFTGRGLLGASSDAVNVARDVIKQWRTKQDLDNLQNFHLALSP